MRICAAQLRPTAGDIEANRERHRDLIELAGLHAADLIFFPELSLIGYEPKLAGALATSQDDPRLELFQALAEEQSMVVGVGAPTAAATGVHIAMVLFQPDKARVTYAKQLLHADEVPYFVHGETQFLLEDGGHAIAPAICYESLQDSHAEHAAALGADIYLASVAKGRENVARGYTHYPAVARRHAMTVLMANCLGPCDDFVAAGQSAVWDSGGKLRGQLDGDGEGLVIFDTATGAAAVHYLTPGARTRAESA